MVICQTETDPRWTQKTGGEAADELEMGVGHLVGYRSRSRRMVVILDNARYHQAEQSTLFFRRYRDGLRLDFLPPYSPELNPIERVWKLLRKSATHNQYFAELDDLIKAVSKQLCAWAEPNPTLEKLCCLISAA